MPFDADDSDLEGMSDLPDMPSDNEPEMVIIPSFQTGGRVEKTGIALVHEGEYIYPASGSEAHISASTQMIGGQVIHYYFPVEIVVVGTLGDAEMKRVAEYVYDEISTTLQGFQTLV